jgi:hypothetical protein
VIGYLALSSPCAEIQLHRSTGLRSLPARARQTGADRSCLTCDLLPAPTPLHLVAFSFALAVSRTGLRSRAVLCCSVLSSARSVHEITKNIHPVSPFPPPRYNKAHGKHASKSRKPSKAPSANQTRQPNQKTCPYCCTSLSSDEP